MCIQPCWHIDNAVLNISNSLSYLGAGLASDNGLSHVQDRIRATRRAFFALQHAGLHFKGLSPEVASHIYSTGIQTVLVYGCESLHINTTNLKQLQITQETKLNVCSV